VAALLVVAVHARDHVFKNYGMLVPIGDWFIFGHAGVDFFFVLSGFIMPGYMAGILVNRAG